MSWEYSSEGAFQADLCDVMGEDIGRSEMGGSSIDGEEEE